MKKYLYSILLLLFAFVPVKVFGEGHISVSPESLTIEIGTSKTFEITAYNTIGDISIASNDSTIASVDIDEWSTGIIEEKQTKTGIVTVTGNSIGTTKITLTIDAATFDVEDLTGQTKTISVNVVAKKEIASIPDVDNTSDETNEEPKKETSQIINQDSKTDNPQTGDKIIYITIIAFVITFC